ncbi:MAG TPA: trypsin-like serine protease, partial [Bacteroidetes bacterium]|nr:trypsin-like serine protease [Bacteroidota bacterium]
MKNRKLFLYVLIAGVLGGIIALTGNKLISPSKQYVFLDNGQRNIKDVSYSNSKYPFNLTKAAEEGTKVVVHIRAEESKEMAQKRLRNRNPYGNFFPDIFDFGRNNQFYRMKGGGSGVIYSKDGYIVTNNHVVDFADDIIVTLPDHREYKAKKIGTDPSTDLAVIKIEENDLPVIQLANSDEAKLGEWVVAVGNPFDYLTSSVTAGIISAKGRNINIIQDDHALEEFIQTDAAVNPGNSGGALLDAEGRLLGITSAIATPTGSYAGY